MRIPLLALALALALAAALAAPALAAEPKPLKLPDGVTPDQLADPKLAAQVADQLEKENPAPRSEALRMLLAVLRGSQLDGSSGWFGPAESRYGWAWLCGKCGVEAKATGIARKSFPGSDDLFDKLDRDGDGTITPADLDWSDRSPHMMRAGTINGIFRRLDTGGDGRVTKEELDAFFKLAAGGKDAVTADDLRRALIPRGPAGLQPGDAPTVPVLVRGLFSGELGSTGEGPKVGDAAPPFKLSLADGSGTVELSKLIGPKPVVLLFGNFTCGPFRAFYPDVEAVQRRFKDRATFLMVYVREAHPTDGWRMGSNARMGVAVKQPTTTAERMEACAQFRKKLDPALTVAVDDVTDPAGTAYSGMPTRLYVIDAAGKVAYKSGRGPFGFKPGEMEQALSLCLLESAK